MITKPEKKVRFECSYTRTPLILLNWPATSVTLFAADLDGCSLQVRDLPDFLVRLAVGEHREALRNKVESRPSTISFAISTAKKYRNSICFP